MRFRPALLRLQPGVHLRPRRLIVRVLLRGPCRGIAEVIRLLAAALRLRLRLRRLRQLWARLKGMAFVARCTRCAFTLRWACHHAGRPLRHLRSLRLGRALLRCRDTRLRTQTIDRARRHQHPRSRCRLAVMLGLRILRARRADQTLWPARTVLPWRPARLATDVCRRTPSILHDAIQTESRCLHSYGSGRHFDTDLISYGRNVGVHTVARLGWTSIRQRTAL